MGEEMLAKEASAAAATRDANARASRTLQELREALAQAQALAAEVDMAPAPLMARCLPLPGADFCAAACHCSFSQQPWRWRAQRGSMLNRREAELAAAQAASVADAKAAAALLAKVRAEAGDAERQLLGLQAELDELAADHAVLAAQLGAAEARVAEEVASTAAARCE
eukprot:SM007095S21382  [mRNA]  locus=s7095:2:502:- [translate_table: standard]